MMSVPRKPPARSAATSRKELSTARGPCPARSAARLSILMHSKTRVLSLRFGRFHRTLSEREKSIADIESREGIPQEIGQALEFVVSECLPKNTFECAGIDKSFEQRIQGALAQALRGALLMAAVGEHDQGPLRRRAVQGAPRLQRIGTRERQVDEDDFWIYDFE